MFQPGASGRGALQQMAEGDQHVTLAGSETTPNHEQTFAVAAYVVEDGVQSGQQPGQGLRGIGKIQEGLVRSFDGVGNIAGDVRQGDDAVQCSLGIGLQVDLPRIAAVSHAGIGGCRAGSHPAFPLVIAHRYHGISGVAGLIL